MDVDYPIAGGGMSPPQKYMYCIDMDVQVLIFSQEFRTETHGRIIILSVRLPNFVRNFAKFRFLKLPNFAKNFAKFLAAPSVISSFRHSSMVSSSSVSGSSSSSQVATSVSPAIVATASVAVSSVACVCVTTGTLLVTHTILVTTLLVRTTCTLIHYSHYLIMDGRPKLY